MKRCALILLALVSILFLTFACQTPPEVCYQKYCPGCQQHTPQVPCDDV